MKRSDLESKTVASGTSHHFIPHFHLQVITPFNTPQTKQPTHAGNKPKQPMLNESLQEVKDYVADIRAKVETMQAEVENSKDDLESLKVELDQKTEEIQVFRVVEVGNLSS